MTDILKRMEARLKVLETEAEAALKRIDLCTVEQLDLEMQILKSILEAIEVNDANPEVLQKEGLQPKLNPAALSLLSSESQALFITE